MSDSKYFTTTKKGEAGDEGRRTGEGRERACPRASQSPASCSPPAGQEALPFCHLSPQEPALRQAPCVGGESQDGVRPGSSGRGAVLAGRPPSPPISPPPPPTPSPSSHPLPSLSGEIHELREDLRALDRARAKDAVKRVIAAMTVGKDVSALFPDVANLMQTGRREREREKERENIGVRFFFLGTPIKNRPTPPFYPPPSSQTTSSSRSWSTSTSPTPPKPPPTSPSWPSTRS